MRKCVVKLIFAVFILTELGLVFFLSVLFLPWQMSILISLAVTSATVQVIFGPAYLYRRFKGNHTRKPRIHYVMVQPGRVPACPECGDAMAIRKVKYHADRAMIGSKFLGCTRFPDCRGTAELSKRSVS